MTAVREATPPDAPLYRLGRLPDPLAWPPWQYVGDGRFDDPLGEFRTLYVAEERLACFIETLAPFRLPLAVLAARRALSDADEPPPPAVATLPADWRAKRAIARLHLTREGRWLDLRALATREALRPAFASLLRHLGLTELDLSAIHGSHRAHRALTCGIARWAYEWGFSGIRYGSRFEERFDCWAIFERPDQVAFRRAGASEPIAPDDPDLLAALHLFGLAPQADRSTTAG